MFRKGKAVTLKEVAIITETEMRKFGKPRGRIIDLIGLEIIDGHVLQSPCGRGKTIGKAKADYAKRLCGKRVVVDAMNENRREFQLPPEITA